MRRFVAVGAVALLAASAFAVSRQDEGGSAVAPGAWEYFVIDADHVVPKRSQGVPKPYPVVAQDGTVIPAPLAPPPKRQPDRRVETQANLNDFGSHGWELCGEVGGQLVFKRPKR